MRGQPCVTQRGMAGAELMPDTRQRRSPMYRGPYGIVGVILAVILIIILLRLLGLF